MNDEILDGGCLCGAVRYRASGPPDSNSICHCRSCRRGSGAEAIAYFKIPLARFTILRGEPRRYRSSPAVERGFCARCGTTLTYAHDEDQADIQVATATLDRPEAWPPTHEVWISQRLRWAATDPARPSFQEGGPGNEPERA